MTVDLPDFESPYATKPDRQGIHPRIKQQIADRLWVGALQIAYNSTEHGRFQAPYPTHVILEEDATITVGFDNFEAELEFRDLNRTTLEICCTMAVDCSSDNLWHPAVTERTGTSYITLSPACSANMLPQAIRYLWRESPCPSGVEQCPIYSRKTAQDTLSLPVPPFYSESTTWITDVLLARLLQQQYLAPSK